MRISDWSSDVCSSDLYDLAHANITVNTIAPGVVGTPEFYRNTSEEFRAQTARSALLNRLGTPEEVGFGVVFLASPQASYITGTTLDINGGAHKIGRAHV